VPLLEPNPSPVSPDPLNARSLRSLGFPKSPPLKILDPPMQSHTHATRSTSRTVNTVGLWPRGRGLTRSLLHEDQWRRNWHTGTVYCSPHFSVVPLHFRGIIQGRVDTGNHRLIKRLGFLKLIIALKWQG